MIERIKASLASLQPRMVEWRRHLHMHPELSFHETRTAAFITDLLRKEGIECRTGLAKLNADREGTGVIALIHGKAGISDRCFALRADTDALPIHEVDGRAHRSCNNGVMHACGHDAHTAMVLGAGIALHQLREHWAGTILLVFQPGEEKEPGGAALLLKQRALRDPAPAGILGQHVTPELEVGKVGFRSGPFMAAADEIYITIQGRGGHASVRQKLVDPIIIATRMIPALYEIADRNTPEGQRMMLSFGKVIANGATNIIPDQVTIDGTLRTFDEGTRAQLHQMLASGAKEIANASGGDVEFRLVKGSPVLNNDPALTERMRSAAAEYFGSDNVVEMEMRLGAEDFAHYTHQMPGCFYRLGTGSATIVGSTSGLHRPEFDIDERALQIGAGLMAWGALLELEN